MNQNKSKKIIITAIIVIVLLIVAISAYMVFATNMLKNDKDVFFQYIGQLTDIEKGFIEKDLISYYTKKETNSFRYETNIKLTGDDIKTDELNIHTTGQTDKTANKKISEISINYPNDIKFPFKTYYADGMQGIQTQYIGNKYITTKNDELKTIKIDSVKNDEIETVKIDLVDPVEDITKAITQNVGKVNTQFNALTEELNHGTFSKVTNNNETGYQVSLSGTYIKNIVEKVKQNIAFNEQITDYIDEIEDADNIQLIIYPKNNSLSKIEVIRGQDKIKVEKTKSENEVAYTIELNLEENKKQATINIKYTGLQSIQNIQTSTKATFHTTNEITKSNKQLIERETGQVKMLLSAVMTDKLTEYSKEPLTIEDIDRRIYTKEMEAEQAENNRIRITIKETNHEYEVDENMEIVKKPEEKGETTTETTTFDYDINNQLEFVEKVNIETLNSDNALMIDDMEEEARDNFMEIVEERIRDVNIEQMGKFGLHEAENPIFVIFPDLNPFPTIVTRRDDTLYPTNQDKEIAATKFNQKFTLYRENVKGTLLNNLLTVIATNNINTNNTNERITQIQFNGDEYNLDNDADKLNEMINNIKAQIDREKEYKVDFEFDEDTGMIYKTIIYERVGRIFIFDRSILTIEEKSVNKRRMKDEQKQK